MEATDAEHVAGWESVDYCNDFHCKMNGPSPSWSQQVSLRYLLVRREIWINWGVGIGRKKGQMVFQHFLVEYDRRQ